MIKIIALALCALIAACYAQAPAQVGQVVFYKSFNDGSLKGWEESYPGSFAKTSFVSGLNGNKALRFSSTTKEHPFLIHHMLYNGEAGEVAGTTVRLSATLKADGISYPSPFTQGNGIRLELILCTYAPVTCTYKQALKLYDPSTYTWNATKANTDIVIPSNIQTVNVSLGLYYSTGSVSFDNVAITVIKSPPVLPANLVWNLTVTCETYFTSQLGNIQCQVTAPPQYVLPNDFEIRIGEFGPYNLILADSICLPSYLANAVSSAECFANTLTTTGDITYSVYARLSKSQEYILTKNTVTTHWQPPPPQSE